MIAGVRSIPTFVEPHAWNVTTPDGDIVAAANGPGTDGYNVATFGQFAPGGIDRFAYLATKFGGAERARQVYSVIEETAERSAAGVEGEIYSVQALGRVNLVNCKVDRGSGARSCAAATSWGWRRRERGRRLRS